jgi:hypothetical protein
LPRAASWSSSLVPPPGAASRSSPPAPPPRRLPVFPVGASGCCLRVFLASARPPARARLRAGMEPDRATLFWLGGWRGAGGVAHRAGLPLSLLLGRYGQIHSCSHLNPNNYYPLLTLPIPTHTQWITSFVLDFTHTQSIICTLPTPYSPHFFNG